MALHRASLMCVLFGFAIIGCSSSTTKKADQQLAGSADLTLNCGLLPPGYSALTDLRGEGWEPDVVPIPGKASLGPVGLAVDQGSERLDNLATTLLNGRLGISGGINSMRKTPPLLNLDRG